MDVFRIENFISKEDSSILSNWTLKNSHKSFFKDANMKGNRKTTRYSTDEDFLYPPEALNIRKKIVDVLNLQENEENKIYPPFKDGIVASFAENNDTCFLHKDPIWVEGYETLHCNIITQAPEKGGELVINNHKYIMKEKELFCYLVSKSSHEVLKIESIRPRLMWVFGFCVNKKQWKNIIKKNND